MRAKTPKNILEKLYWESKLSTYRISTRLGINAETIRRWMVQYGIPRRSLSAALMGELSPNWKGGRKKHQGYVMVLLKEHPRANRDGYIYEHIVVWEQANGCPVPKGWQVHHYNGIKDDNCPSNLFAKSEKKHKLIIPELQKRIQELEARLKQQYILL